MIEPGRPADRSAPTPFRFAPRILHCLPVLLLLASINLMSGCGGRSTSGNTGSGAAANSTAPASLSPPAIPPHAEIISTDGDEQTFMVPMRDGVKLATYVYGAASNGEPPAASPIILVRTPYGHEQIEEIARAAEITGYTVVVQDVRGRYASQGDFQMVFKEGDDGYDTIEWIAAQPWSNGKIGMFGMSYLGITQWAAAIESPPHLTCIFPIVAPSDYYNGMVYQNGALRQELTGGWLDDMAVHSNWWKDHQKETNEDPALNETEAKWQWHLPLYDPGPIARGGPALISLWHQLLDHPSEDAFWRQLNPSSHYAGVKVPALILGGWYDIFNQGCIDNYLGVKNGGGTALARDNVHLIMGPFSHAMRERVGQRDFGREAHIDYLQLALPWFDHWLKGEANGVENWPPVRTFVMGENRWVERKTWPPAGTHSVPFYVGSRDGSHEAGALLRSGPSAGRPISYSYNPANPVPTHGGANLTIPAGVADQRVVETRPDVLSFTTPPLTQPVHIAGRVQVRLWASASTPDTDFTAKLVDVGPDGYAANVLDGIIRARCRLSLQNPTPIRPKVPLLYTIDLWSTDKVFLKGHRIRLEVASSNFPRFSRNLNTGLDSGKDTTPRVSNIVVYDDLEHPSSLDLPVVSESSPPPAAVRKEF